MRVKEYHSILIKEYPYAESLNKRLLKDAESLLETHHSNGPTNIKGKRTCNIYDQSSNIQRLVSWILDE